MPDKGWNLNNIIMIHRIELWGQCNSCATGLSCSMCLLKEKQDLWIIETEVKKDFLKVREMQL